MLCLLFFLCVVVVLVLFAMCLMFVFMSLCLVVFVRFVFVIRSSVFVIFWGWGGVVFALGVCVGVLS